jgi:hypothetical protein
MHPLPSTAAARRSGLCLLPTFRAAMPIVAALGAALGLSASPAQAQATDAPAGKAPSLEETRITLGKWIETQQIISKERNDWQQAKEILRGRIELVGKEVSVLRDRIVQSEMAVKESDKKRDELNAQNDQLKAVQAELLEAVSGMEGEIRKLAKMMPQPVSERIEPLLQRMPTESSASRVSIAERFQNVLGILNELNKANSEISVAYEIRTLGDGSTSEVQVIYVGLAQAYYISPRGEVGVGEPGEDGWTWRPEPGARRAIMLALEVIEGKHAPTFVNVPLRIR